MSEYLFSLQNNRWNGDSILHGNTWYIHRVALKDDAPPYFLFILTVGKKEYLVGYGIKDLIKYDHKHDEIIAVNQKDIIPFVRELDYSSQEYMDLIEKELKYHMTHK